MYPTAMEPDALVVYCLSDGSGQTADMVAKAAVAQFSGARVARLPRIASEGQLEQIVKLASQGPRCVLAYTIVRPELKATIERASQAHGVPAVDLLGPLIAAIAGKAGESPRREAGLLQAKDEEYFKRMEAIDYAIRYDDGKSPQGLKDADLVLVGVSRTSKTPTSLYLAQHEGLKTANVPLVPGIEPPAVLFSMPSAKIVGLTVNPDLLAEIRASRLVALGLPPESAYGDRQAISDETAFARTIFKRLGCPVVDVTHKAVEETASEILALLQQDALPLPRG